MRSALAWLLAVTAAAWGQAAEKVAMTTPALAAPCVNGPKITPQSFTGLESAFGTKMTSLKDPVDVVGGPLALYLRDYGLTLTAGIMLVQTPTVNPFRREISEADKVRTHERKLAQVPPLKQAMREMVRQSALLLGGAVALQGTEGPALQVVVSVKVMYFPWEDTSNLPGQIIMKADLKNAMAGHIQEEDQ